VYIHIQLSDVQTELTMTKVAGRTLQGTSALHVISRCQHSAINSELEAKKPPRVGQRFDRSRCNADGAGQWSLWNRLFGQSVDRTVTQWVRRQRPATTI